MPLTTQEIDNNRQAIIDRLSKLVQEAQNIEDEIRTRFKNPTLDQLLKQLCDKKRNAWNEEEELKNLTEKNATRGMKKKN